MNHPYRLFGQILGVFIMTLTLSPCFADTQQPIAPTTATPFQNNYPFDTQAAVHPNVAINSTVAGLQAALITYQNAASHPWPMIYTKGLLRPKMKSSNIILIRERLRLIGDLASVDDVGGNQYDALLKRAVMHFQQRHGLKADGVIGPNTITALNVTPQERIKQIQVNIQRWAHLIPELGQRYIIVNVPQYELDLIDNGKKVLTMKAIVGKPERETPEVYSRVNRIVFNPYWNVPVKIAKKDIVPKIINDPNYLAENNIRVWSNPSENAREVNAEDIDWQSVQQEGFKYHFRQEPGEANSLGLVKFEFPNPYDVYLHDTPAKNLFDSDKRSFSSGCIRLERPFDLATYLIRDNDNWSNDRLQEVMNSGKTTYVSLATPMPIFITYMTAWIDDEGLVEFREDIYNRDNASNPLQTADMLQQNNPP